MDENLTGFFRETARLIEELAEAQRRTVELATALEQRPAQLRAGLRLKTASLRSDDPVLDWAAYECGGQPNDRDLVIARRFFDQLKESVGTPLLFDSSHRINHTTLVGTLDSLVIHPWDVTARFRGHHFRIDGYWDDPPTAYRETVKRYPEENGYFYTRIRCGINYFPGLFTGLAAILDWADMQAVRSLYRTLLTKIG